MMKGQYRIVFETLLILVGIFITGYVISNFGNLQKSVTDVGIKDNFNTLSGEIGIGLVKASANPSAVVRVAVPAKMSDHTYIIRLEEDNKIFISSLADNKINVTREIFNIGQVNRIIESQVLSSAQTVEIVSEGGFLRIRRGLA